MTKRAVPPTARQMTCGRLPYPLLQVLVELSFDAIDDGIYRVWFSTLELGRFDVRQNRVTPLSPRGDNGPCGAASAASSSTTSTQSDNIIRKEPLFTMCPA